MSGPTTVADDIEIVLVDDGKGGGGAPPAGGDDDGDDKRRGPEPPSPSRYYTGVAIGIVAIFMFFMALTSAYIVRKGVGSDWVPVVLPRVLWANTAILLASSLTLELARRRLAATDRLGFRTFWLVTTGLGTLFLAGQVIAWRQLVAAGIYLPTNPGSSFFYLFTGAHALHLLGGVGALVYVAVRHFEKARISLATAAEVASYYWHFMDGLWVFLFAILFLGR